MEPMPRSGFSDGPHVLGAVTLLARLVQEALASQLSDLGITFAQAVALVRLWQAPDGTLPQSELIEKLAVSRASGSLVLGELESAGYLNRSIDPLDARRQVVTLTDDGRRIEADVHAAFEGLESWLFDPIGSEEWKTTYTELRSAIETLIAHRGSDL